MLSDHYLIDYHLLPTVSFRKPKTVVIHSLGNSVFMSHNTLYPKGGNLSTFLYGSKCIRWDIYIYIKVYTPKCPRHMYVCVYIRMYIHMYICVLQE